MANTIFLADLYFKYINLRYHVFGCYKLVERARYRMNGSDFSLSLTRIKQMSKLINKCLNLVAP
jgi:hypothetical protein